MFTGYSQGGHASMGAQRVVERDNIKDFNLVAGAHLAGPYNLGGSRVAVFFTITLPALKPALIGAAAISFLMSFENFNTTLMLVGSDSPLTVMMYGRMREGATPVLNAVSLFLMLASAALALSIMRQPAENKTP